MIAARFRPLINWPRPFTKGRRHSRFRVGYHTTLTHIEKELGYLNARNIVIQIALRPEDIRLDGWPRANARQPEHPGVLLSFDSKHGPLNYMCDAFIYWEENLRAIGLTLERLRLVDLYGVTKSGEQYQGWTALPAPGSDVINSREEAARFISEHSCIVVTAHHTDADALQRAYRAAARKLHPDTETGSHELFLMLKQAVELLGASHAG